MANLTSADLVFGEQANHNFSRTLGELKRSTLSIENRLRSMLTDAQFVQDVWETYSGAGGEDDDERAAAGLGEDDEMENIAAAAVGSLSISTNPRRGSEQGGKKGDGRGRCGRSLIANERCGSWYIDPATKGGGAYFKSTDGHTSVWKFSLRRLNLHLLPLVNKRNGCLIVDSTRRGKRIPDALSKTIPIWICVLNRALFERQEGWEEDWGKLRTPPGVVSEMEHAQINARIPQFVSDFLSLGLDLDKLRRKVGRPMRPLWITPDSNLPGAEERVEDIFPGYHPVVLITASRRVKGTEVGEGGYVQGSGDDTENWAHGLTPPVFWENIQLLMDTPEADLPEVIERLVDEHEKAKLVNKAEGEGGFEAVPPSKTLRVLPIPQLSKQGEEDIFIVLSPTTTAPETWLPDPKAPRLLTCNVGTAKLGARALRSALPIIMGFIKSRITGGGSKITVSCPDGKDLSVGCGLAVLCLLYKDDGELLGNEKGNRIDKLFIRQRLTWITNQRPEANPSRSTLQSVNAFLMDRQ